MHTNNSNTLIFLPGWGFSSQIFALFAKQLKAEVMLLELRLSGSCCSLDEMAQQIAELIPKNSTIIAWSFGGLIALKLCALFPHKCKRLMLMASTPYFAGANNWVGIDPKTIMYFINLFNLRFDYLMKYFINLTNHPNSDRHIKQHIKNHHFISNARCDKAHLLQSLKLLFHTDLRKTYSTLTIPVLHLLGDKDAVISIDHAALTSLNKNITLKTIKNAGHALFLTHADNCLTHIKKFLQEN